MLALAAIHNREYKYVYFSRLRKKLKSRISSYKSSFNKEKKEYGYIRDGAGKRYILFSLHLVLNDLDKSEKYFNWYENEFPDDCGEPIQKLCWSLSLFRMDKVKDAKIMLADLMLSNLYLIPHVIGDSIKKEYNIWHSTNFHYLDYTHDIPDEVIDCITSNEIEWLKENYNSLDFRRIRKRHIEIYQQLLSTKELEPRKKLLNEAYSLLNLIQRS